MAERLPGWPLWLGAMVLDAPSIALAIELGCRGIAVDAPTITTETFTLFDGLTPVPCAVTCGGV